MSGYTWDFSVVWQNLPMLLQGLLGSLQITVVALLLGLLLGLVVAPLGMSTLPYLRLPANVYINVFRSTPPLYNSFGSSTPSQSCSTFSFGPLRQPS